MYITTPGGILINCQLGNEGCPQEATKYEVSVERFDLREGKDETFFFEVKLGQIEGARIIEEYETDRIS